MVKKEAVFVDREALRELGLEERLSQSDLPNEVIEAIRVNGDLTKYLAGRYTQAMAERDRLKAELFDLKQQYAEMEEIYQQQITSLEEQIELDGLTGALNRRSFDRRFPAKASEADRHPETYFSLAMLDIDHFKQINDTYGHQGGDYVLQKFAEVIMDRKRAEDMLYRYGGEEFVIIMPQTSLEQAELAAERIRSAVEGASFVHEGRQIPVTISLGLAGYQRKEGHDSILGRADKALYEAKGTGRNKIVTSKQ